MLLATLNTAAASAAAAVTTTNGAIAGRIISRKPAGSHPSLCAWESVYPADGHCAMVTTPVNPRKESSSGKTQKNYIPLIALRDLSLRHTSIEAAQHDQRNYYVCRMCYMKGDCAPTGSGSRPGCIICFRSSASQSSLTCAACRNQVRNNHINDKDYHRTFVCGTLLQPLITKLRTYRITAVSEQRTFGSHQDGRNEMRFDLFVRAMNEGDSVSIAIEFVSSSNITASSMQFKLKWMVDEAKGASSNKSVLLIIKHTPNDADVVVQLALLRCWITAFIEEAKYLHGGNSVKFVTMGFSAEEIAANKHFAGGQHLEWNAAPACKGHEFKYCLYPKEYSRFKGQSPPQYFMHNEILK